MTGRGVGEETIVTPAGSMHLRSAGAGLPVLLLHGFLGTGAAWEAAGITQTLAREWRVLTPDLPGHGGTPPGPLEAPAAEGEGMRRVVALVTALLDALEIGALPWVGYSMGGRVALSAATLAPDRLSALVLESASPGIDSPTGRAHRRALDEERAQALEREGIGPFVDAWESLPLFAAERKEGGGGRGGEGRRPAGEMRPPAPGADDLDGIRRSQDPRGLAIALRRYGTGSYPPPAPPPHRTLLLTGEKDPRFTASARHLHGRMPHGIHHIVPGAGHAIHRTAPERWLAAVRPFLGAAAPVTPRW